MTNRATHVHSYFETVGFMYACMNFNIRQHPCLTYLQNTLLPVRFETIRHLDGHTVFLVGAEYDTFFDALPAR